MSLIPHPPEKTTSTAFWRTHPYWVMFGAVVLSIIVAHVFVAPPRPPANASHLERAAFFSKHKSHKRAEQEYLRAVAEAPDNLELNRTLITAHFAVDEDRRYVTDSALEAIYQTRLLDLSERPPKPDSLKERVLHSSSDLAIDDLVLIDTITVEHARYCLGLCKTYEKSYDSALTLLGMVTDTTQRYLHFTTGNVRYWLKQYDAAKEEFEKELAVHGYVAGAYDKLAKLAVHTGQFKEAQALLAQPAVRDSLEEGDLLDDAYGTLFEELSLKGDWQTIEALCRDSVAAANCPPTVRRCAFFDQQQFLPYLSLLYQHLATSITTWGFWGALLITVLWLWYLRKIDLFEAEKLSYLLLTLGLGMIFCILVFPVSDWLFSVRYPWHETGALPHDVLYFTVAVGLVEEAVKFVPFLLVLAMTKEIDEPIDYLIYASNAALGFAFMENLEYFHRGNLDIMTMRMLLSVFGHMFFTSTAAYGVVLGMRSGSTVKRYLYPLVGYLVAASVHGLYDALLLNGHVITAYILQALVIFQFGIYLTNLLNASPHFSESHADDAHALKTQLFYGFVAVLILQYFAVVMESGPGVADATLAVSAVLGIGFLVLLASRLVPHGLHHGEWMDGLEGVVRGTISAPLKEAFRAYALTVGAVALGLYVITEQPDLLLQYVVIIAFRLLVAIIRRWRAVRKAARQAAVATPA